MLNYFTCILKKHINKGFDKLCIVVFEMDFLSKNI